MSDESNVARGDSSANSSTTGSFENVSASSVSDNAEASAKAADDDEASEENNEVKHIDDETSPLEKLDEQGQYFTGAHARTAIKHLIRFTAAMFVLPLLTMFTTYHFIFRDYLHLPLDRAMLYAGMCGIAVVIIIVTVFIYVAYREEKEDEKIKFSLKKSE